MSNHASYILSTYSPFKNLSMDQLLQIGSNQSNDRNPIPSFDEDLLINLCLEAQAIFEKENNILEIDDDTIVVGDIHGNLLDLSRILNYIELNTSKILFLGDYVDRGNFSLECITLLFALKVNFPNKYFLLRGNHEFDAMCSHYGFKKEILNYHNPKKLFKIEKEKDEPMIFIDQNQINFGEEEEKKEIISQEQRCDEYFSNHVNMNCYKYSEKLYNAFLKVFSYLPICAIVNKKTVCIHGGLSPLLDKIDKINLIKRPIDDFDHDSLLSDLLWSDPSCEIQHFFEHSPRGRGKLFSGIAVINYLKNNNYQRIIRGHECVNEGIEFLFKEKCITVFSASSYDRDVGNDSGILKIYKQNDHVEPIIFEPLHHLQKYDAIYYKVQPINYLSFPKATFSHENFKSLHNFEFLQDFNHFNQTKSTVHFHKKENLLPNNEDLKIKQSANNLSMTSRPNKLRTPTFIKYHILGNKIAFNSGSNIISNRRSSLVNFQKKQDDGLTCLKDKLPTLADNI